ncbi:MAG TPA: aspartate kinase [Ferruginibacter sp.]|nr:aspartate kinase [Ferruginibacter sp.]
MKVFKFGGASISNIERIHNLPNIVRFVSGEKLLLVISAMGKTTNALEKVVDTWFNGKTAEALALFEQVKELHLTTLKYCTVLQWQEAEGRLKDFFTEVEWMLHDKPVKPYDYYYDQVVCCGELLSSNIISQYFTEEKIKNKWVDVRDIIRTDNNFRDAVVDWEETKRKINDTLLPLFEEYDIIITQGFIGATDENESTTLGREGSDYSAAIFANLLEASSVTIWKDVEAVMNADPRQFKDAVNIPALSYTEVIEMAYYGAQVIHPKTIKPLQNKNIPLIVKSFLDPAIRGTIISGSPSKNLPPVIVVKENQVLINFRSKDFDFVGDRPVQQLQELYHALKIKPNLSQNTAISLLCCFDNHPVKMDQLASEAAGLFDVELEKGLTLVTIRHYDEETIMRFIKDKQVVLEQKTLETVQLLMRS